MPTLAELLKAEGVEVSPELEAKLPTLTEASDEVRGLVTTKQELLQWKNDNADKVSGFNEIQTKYETELNEREKLAIANKDFEEQIKIRDERAKRQDEQLAIRNQQAKSSAEESAVMQVAGLFQSQEVGRLIAKNYANVELGEDGSVNTTYTLNGESFSDFNLFKSAAEKVDYLASQMAAPQSSGPSGKGGQGGGQGKNFKDMTATERAQLANTDPTLYNQLSKA